MAAIVSSGLGSGIDITGLVQQLVAAEGQPKILKIESGEARAQAKLSALGSLKAAFSAFQASLSSHQSITNFGGLLATSDDKKIFTAKATNGAAVTNYSIEISNLAKSHKIKSNAFASKSTSIGSGKITFQFGTYDSGGNTFTLNPDKVAQSITISSSSGTLEGIRNAVNQEDIGVTANIIDDGTGPRLVFSSNDSGLKNSLKITIDDDDTTDTDSAGLSQLAYDPTASVGNGKNLTETVAALDASFIIDGLTITSASNTVTSAIDNVTLTLIKEDAGTTHQLNVKKDKSSVKNFVNSFISSFNNLITTVDSLSSYDKENKIAGLLLGDATLCSMEDKTRRIISAAVGGISTQYTALSTIGITTDAKGMLSLDEDIIDKVIDDDINSVGKLFATVGTPSDTLVRYHSATSDSKIGQYTLSVSQSATQGNLLASQAANLTITSGVNDTLVLMVDDQTATITLTAGTYTAVSLAAELQSKANGAKSFKDNNVAISVSESAGVLTLTSDSYGSSSTVDVTGGSGQSDLVGATPTLTTGLDIIGKIGGQTATGEGRFLTGVGNAQGLKIEITGGAIGTRGTIDFSRGVAVQLDEMLDDFLDSEGVVDSRTKALNKRIENFEEERRVLSRRLKTIELRYLKQFTALDTFISTLRTTSEFLGQQLANLPGPKKPSNN